MKFYKVQMYIKFEVKIVILIATFYFSSCAQNNNEKDLKSPEVHADTVSNRILKTDFIQILDSAKVNGSILIYKSSDDEYYSNDFDWALTGHLPASTFKIPNSLIGLETGIVENDSTLFVWDGKKRRIKTWEQDLIFRDAFHFSCVPCYQQIARQVGSDEMNKYIHEFGYGNLQIDSSNIDRFWLEGNSTIDQMQQIDFLKRFYFSELPISDRTHNIMKEMMVLEKTESYSLSGKTGWSIREGHNNGWFVGYVETKTDVYFFATNIEPKESFNLDMFPMIRKQITMTAFKRLGI